MVVYGNEDGLKQGMSKRSWVISLFSNLTGVVVAQMCTHIKNHQVAHLRPMHFTACKGFKQTNKHTKKPRNEAGQESKRGKEICKGCFLKSCFINGYSSSLHWGGMVYYSLAPG